VLQDRFVIVGGSARLLEEEDISIIMRGCVIQHNMIVEDELAFDYDVVNGTILETIVSVIHAMRHTFKERQSFAILKHMHVFKWI